MRTKKYQTFEINKSLWRFTRYSCWNTTFLKQIRHNGGQWNVEGYSLWYFNGFFFAGFWISSFYFIYCQAIYQLINWINHEAACLWRNIYDHRRDLYGCSYIPKGLWCVMRSTIITDNIFTLTISKVKGNFECPWWIGRKFDPIFCYFFSHKEGGWEKGLTCSFG